MSSCVSKRCSCFAVTTGLKCKLKTKNKYCNKYVCHVHAVILFNYSILYIQKMYIGYRTRRKLKNIFVDKDLRCVIGDLGIATKSIDTATSHVGTFPLNAPEMYSRDSYN